MLAKKRGGRSWPTSFADRLTHPVPDSRAVRKLITEGGMRPDLSQVDRIPVHPAADRLPPAGTGEVVATWVGHASFVLQIGGLVVLTDPVWSRRIPGVRPRFTPPGLRWEALPPVDAVVISHNHFDHLDAPTIRRLPRRVLMLVPGGLGWWFRRLGFTAVVELDWWESARLGAVEFHFVPVHHWSRRTLFDGCQSLWGGWMLEADAGPAAPAGAAPAGAAPAGADPVGPAAGAGAGPTAGAGPLRVFFAGDSAYGPYFAEIGRRHGPVDLALMPVGAYLPRWFMKPLHMSPPEAVRACGDLGARRMATMHWGAFALSAEAPLAPLEQARQAWQASARAAEDLWDLAVGESRTLHRAVTTPAAG
ncbi:MBL fold metallo-hydrolase [Micromonospora sp. NPDC007230]|uniref:MBL fold metallo-hydrolase n=1 Tax=Micromonospora sp. NPDC007230 TaxID=3364237 RepID=UPI003673DDBA